MSDDSLASDVIRDWLSDKIIKLGLKKEKSGNQLRHYRHMLRDLKKNVKETKEKTGQDLNR